MCHSLFPIFSPMLSLYFLWKWYPWCGRHDRCLLGMLYSVKVQILPWNTQSSQRVSGYLQHPDCLIMWCNFSFLVIRKIHKIWVVKEPVPVFPSGQLLPSSLEVPWTQQEERALCFRELDWTRFCFLCFINHLEEKRDEKEKKHTSSRSSYCVTPEKVENRTDCVWASILPKTLQIRNRYLLFGFENKANTEISRGKHETTT